MVLSKSRRIILNTLATYGRSVLALFVGVFSSRWLLQGLGAEDLGLQGVVGSLIGALVIFETVMQVAVARFYAYAIGAAQTMSSEDGKDEVCRWFNVVLFIHLVLPTLVLIIGWPVGLYAVQHWLTIPAARMDACIYVFHCAMISTAISMVTTPYLAMYQAKQEIVELSLFNVARTLINFGFTFSLLYVTCDRLEYSATFGLLVGLVILGIQMYRACKLFPECRLRVPYLIDWTRLKQIFLYFFWEIFSCTGNMTRQQGSSIVVNKCFGPQVNAAWTIANTLSNQATALSSALTGALLPAVTTEEGAGARDKMIALAFRSCKFGTLLILLFSIPLIAEMDEVLRLWLVTPPPFTASLCSCILIAYAIDKLGLGHHVAISANGKIGRYHSVVGTTFFLSVPVALGLVWCGVGPASVGWMFVIVYGLVTIERVIFAHFLVGMSIRHFMFKILIPLVIFSLASYAAAVGVTCCFEPSFFRIVLSSAAALFVMLIVGRGLLLDAEERAYVMAGVKKITNRMRKRQNEKC